MHQLDVDEAEISDDDDADSQLCGRAARTRERLRPYLCPDLDHTIHTGKTIRREQDVTR
jgi:hypothetical protein